MNSVWFEGCVGEGNGGRLEGRSNSGECWGSLGRGYPVHHAGCGVYQGPVQGALERDRMARGEPNQLYWAGFFLFGPFPEENMFGFS